MGKPPPKVKVMEDNKKNNMPEENAKITDISELQKENENVDAFIKENIKGFDNIKPDEGLPEEVSTKITDGMPIPTPELQEVKKKKHKGLKIAISFAACLCAVLLVATIFLDPLRSMIYDMTSTITNGALDAATFESDFATGTAGGSSEKKPSAAIKGEAVFDGSEKDIIGDAAATDDGLTGTSSKSYIADIEAGEIEVTPDDKDTDTESTVSKVIDEIIEQNTQQGSLTAGEWNDNDNWDFFKKVIKSNQDFVSYQKSFSIYPSERIAVTVNSSGKPVVNATVMGYSSNNELIWAAVTDNQGKAYLFPNLFTDKSQDSIASVKVVSGSFETTVKTESKKELTVDLENAEAVKKALDLMFVIDTTGSMSDELNYLQWELQSIVNTVKNENPDITIRLSINFYRDEGDEYVVKANPFSSDIENTIEGFSSEEAAGGGDYEEAVEQAVANAINEHEWDETSYARLMFLILDAPPHETDEVVETMNNAIQAAAEKGIRIISVAASGVNKRTEMMLRSFAVVTGGTYTFLTDDSGIGNSHIEPTIGEYEVKPFKQVITDVINGYLK